MAGKRTPPPPDHLRLGIAWGPVVGKKGHFVFRSACVSLHTPQGLMCAADSILGTLGRIDGERAELFYDQQWGEHVVTRTVHVLLDELLSFTPEVPLPARTVLSSYAHLN